MTKQQFELVLAQMRGTTMMKPEWPYVVLYPSSDLAIGPFKERFVSRGYHYRGISYVEWIQTKISFFRIAEGAHAISYKFSGCIMAKFKFQNKWYAAHIATEEKPDRDCKAVWNDFYSEFTANGMLTDVHIFKPYAVQEIKTHHLEIMDTRNWRKAAVCGVITSTNECYSCILDLDNFRFVGGKDWAQAPEIQPPILSLQ